MSVRFRKALFIELLLALVVIMPSSSALAGGGDQAVTDSLLSSAGSEPSLQEILDSLGYNIDVVNDELDWENFCVPTGDNMALLMEEISTSYFSAYAGWYNSADTAQRSQLFGPDNHAQDSISFTIAGTSGIGFYFEPGISGGYVWHTETLYNIDSYDHAKVFATKQNPNEYIIAFEDLKNGGDADFNDLIIKIRFANEPPVVQLPDDMYYKACLWETLCFDIHVWDNNCLGDTLTLEMVQGAGTFYPVTGVGSIDATHCFLPSTTDSTYTFVFKATDRSGLTGYDTLLIDYDFNEIPQLFVPDDFDTLVCEGQTVCFSISGSDPDGDRIEFEMIQGFGDIDPQTGEVCFVPELGDSADYMFILRATDSCCAQRDEAVEDGTSCPPPCPIDTVIVTVMVVQGPEIVAVPDIDTSLCEAAIICFPITIESPGDRPVIIDVTSPATYDEISGEVCLPADQEGAFEIVITATDEICGVGDVDTVMITVDLNAPPTVVLPDDTTFVLCTPEEICFTAIGYDPDGDSLDFILESGLGQIDPITGEVCFTPTGAGSYEFIVSVMDTCEASGVDTIVIDVNLNSPPVVDAPDTTLNLCGLTETCFTVTASDPDPDDELTFSLLGGQGVIDPFTGEVCFTPEAAGSYQFEIEVADLCGETDIDTASILIGLNHEPVITLNPVDTVYLCELGDSVCFTIDVDDPDIGQSLTVEQLEGVEGNLNSEMGEFCFLPDAAGIYQFEFRVVDECGAADTAATEIVIILNGVPVVDLPEDFSKTLCSAEDICFPVMIDDDGEVAVEVIPIGSYADGQVCFRATKDTTYCITVRATDTCGLYDEDQICVDVAMNDAPTISLGPDQNLNLCELPDTLCFDYTAYDPDGTDPIVTLTVGEGVVADGKICFEPNSAGTYYFIARATDECGEFVDDDILITIEINNPPEIHVADDSTFLLCGPEQICFDNSAVDADSLDNLTFELIYGTGVIFPQTGRVCFTPPTAGTYQFVVRVSDDCGASDQDTVEVTVQYNNPPSIVGTGETLEVVYCSTDDDPVNYCFVGIEVSDPDENDELTVTKTCGPGTFDSSTLTTCFAPEPTDSMYEFCYRVTDLCGAYDEVSLFVTVTVSDTCDTTSCLTVWIEDIEDCVLSGSDVVLNVFTDVNEGIGGFDLLMQYDVTGFTFTDAVAGPALAEWEYFTYRLNVSSNGTLRLVAITDINNGAHHPSPEAFFPSGSIAQIMFRTTNDLNFGGMFFPVTFIWYDCGDNSFSSITGDTLMVDKLIIGHEGVIIWDEFDDVNYPEENRPFHIGAPDECLVGGKTAPLRCVVFKNGGICIVHPDSIDLRGDVNLNSVTYEIADAVLFINYFIFGLSVFTVNPPGQIAATDINADGITLTVGDLVYLIRIINGDVMPIQKLSHYSDALTVDIHRTDNSMEISSRSKADIGGGYFVFEFDPSLVTPGKPVLSEDASNMEMIYSIEDGTMKVLIYSLSTEKINTGINSLLTIPVEGDGTLELTYSEFADYYGNQLAVTQKTVSILPGRFELTQNYPNPFNPETEFDMHLPYSSDWNVQIFNVQGQVVKSMNGSSAAGVVKIKWNGTDDSGSRVSSGIYFYRATAGEHSETKKMVLIK